MNTVTIIGNLAADPEVKLFNNNKLVNFKVATNERKFTTSTGKEIPERTEFHKIAVRGRLAEFASNYLKKGNKVGLSGTLRTRSYQDKDNKTIYVTEIHANTIELLTPKNNKQELAAVSEEHENSDLPF